MAQSSIVVALYELNQDRTLSQIDENGKRDGMVPQGRKEATETESSSRPLSKLGDISSSVRFGGVGGLGNRGLHYYYVSIV